jgi:UDP-N-acetylmuramate-alanine ligase
VVAGRREDNVELVAAREPAAPRCCRERQVLETVARCAGHRTDGTHGKTTATSMMVHVLHAARA